MYRIQFKLPCSPFSGKKDGDIIGTRCVRGRPTKVQLEDISSPTDILNETKQMIVKSRGPCPDLQNKLPSLAKYAFDPSATVTVY